MTSIRLKFRPSTNPAKEGTLVFQLIHKRTVRRIRSKYRIRNDEWDKKFEEIALPSPASERYSRLKIIRSNIMYELKRLKAIAEKLDCSGKDYSLDEIIQKYISGTDTGCSVFDFIRAQVAHKKQLGKIRSSETYQTTLNSFMRFREGIDLTFDMIDSELMEHYEAELRRHGLLRNTSSFYMRVLRTNYRLAVEKGLTPDRHPFKHVYCGMDKTVKRSISFAEIKKIKELDLSRKRVMDFARDMFIFSFCTRGMSFIDMAYLKKNDLKHGCLTYRRKKDRAAAGHRMDQTDAGHPRQVQAEQHAVPPPHHNPGRRKRTQTIPEPDEKNQPEAERHRNIHQAARPPCLYTTAATAGPPSPAARTFPYPSSAKGSDTIRKSPHKFTWTPSSPMK